MNLRQILTYLFKKYQSILINSYNLSFFIKLEIKWEVDKSFILRLSAKKNYDYIKLIAGEDKVIYRVIINYV